MAKQTFTTGQVLTAAQMTSLQQTAMLGGAASAKTASYTLVAADAGTAISMSNASATTITVNTALFAAGDTVQITNLGAGVCTITAGTATVNTSASLALAQYESGTLDFTSTSAAIFIKGAGAAATSGGMTLISTTSLTGAEISLTSIPSTYNDLRLVIRNFKPASDGFGLKLKINTNTGNVYYSEQYSSSSSTINGGSTLAFGANNQDDTTSEALHIADFFDYTNTTTWKILKMFSIINNATTPTDAQFMSSRGVSFTTGAISSIQILAQNGNLTSGTALLYGVK